MNLCEKCKSELPESRTIQQNKFLHVCFGILAEHSGCSLNQIKILLKKEFGYYNEVLNKKTGEVLIEYKSTANMTKKEFSEFTEQVINFAGSHGVNIPPVEDYLYYKQLNKTQV